MAAILTRKCISKEKHAYECWQLSAFVCVFMDVCVCVCVAEKDSDRQPYCQLLIGQNVNG